MSAWLARFEAALKAGNINEVLSLFGDDCYWRDLLTFTWNIYTSEGKEEIRKMLQSCLDNTKPSNWRLTGTPTVDPQFNTVDAFFSFETALARADGHIRLKDGRCWTLLTTMQELKGHEEKKGPSRPRGTVHGVHKDRKSWLAQKEEEERTLGFEKQPYVVIIGGGQGGIGLGARLKQLGVPTIIVDKHKRPGDQWRSRYKSLCLHDPVWYDHLPYLPFPAHWPIYCPKDKIGDWLEMYTKIMELNYWSSTECLKASFDEDTKEWTVTVDKEGETVVLRPKHLIFALGVSGFPNIPTFKGSDTFKGDQHHSSAHSGGDSYKGKKVVVIGGNNSAHDICADLYEHGVDVTMIQRTSTHIIRADTMMEVVFKPLYSEEAVDAGITTHKADLLFASMPFKIMHKFQIPIYEQVKQHDKEFYDKLRKRGFILDFGDDDSGLFLKYLRRGSGYYIDVGASELIVNGSIKLKSGVQISRIDPHSVVMADGTEIPADVIVYATGYNSMTEWVSKLVSQGVADKGNYPYFLFLFILPVFFPSSLISLLIHSCSWQVLGTRIQHHQGPRPMGG